MEHVTSTAAVEASEDDSGPSSQSLGIWESKHASKHCSGTFYMMSIFYFDSHAILHSILFLVHNVQRHAVNHKTQWTEVQEAFKASEISARNASPAFSGASTTTTHSLLSAASSAQAAGSITKQSPWIRFRSAAAYNALHDCWLCTFHGASPASFCLLIFCMPRCCNSRAYIYCP